MVLLYGVMLFVSGYVAAHATTLENGGWLNAVVAITLGFIAGELRTRVIEPSTEH